ncbi:MAG: hypothetical protein HY716_07085 [Planctomycetes bacterium]|nr:hypothetical protein [Planctomycetota bacterium]
MSTSVSISICALRAAHHGNEARGEQRNQAYDSSEYKGLKVEPAPEQGRPGENDCALFVGQGAVQSLPLSLVALGNPRFKRGAAVARSGVVSTWGRRHCRPDKVIDWLSQEAREGPPLDITGALARILLRWPDALQRRREFRSLLRSIHPEMADRDPRLDDFRFQLRKPLRRYGVSRLMAYHFGHFVVALTECQLKVLRAWAESAQSIGEAATRLGVSTSAVCRTLQRCRFRLNSRSGTQDENSGGRSTHHPHKRPSGSRPWENAESVNETLPFRNAR